MFEKDIETYLQKHIHYDEGHERHYYDMPIWQMCEELAEFAYNKANEWHFIKDELPPEHVPLNIITFDKNKNRRLWEGEYKGGNGKYWTGYFNHFIDVPYAWKEIVLPEFEDDKEN